MKKYILIILWPLAILNIASKVSSQSFPPPTGIPVFQGGIGVTTVTGILVGNGTDPFTGVIGGASQFLRRNAGNTAYEFATIAGGGDLLAANNLDDLLSAPTALTNLGGTAIGVNLFTLPNPGAVRFPRFNADNTITHRTAAEFLSDIGGQASGTYITDGGALGTPSSGTATNITGLPLTTGVTGILPSANGGTANGFTKFSGATTTEKTYTLPDATTTIFTKNYTGALATGILKNTTTTGELTIAVAGDFPTLNQSTTGSAATLTTSRNINGVAFNGSADITVTAAAGTLTGTTLNATVVTSSLTTVGTIGTGTWQGGVISSTFGGTGVNNGGRTLTLNTNSGTIAFSAASKTMTFGNSVTLNGTDATTITLPAVTSTLLPNTTTSGVAATPTASSTVTVTHNLGRVPTTIDIHSISSFTANAAAVPVPFSTGTWNSTGNRCLYMTINGTSTQVSQTSTVFSIIMVTSAGNNISGVIGNVTSTGFDIVFTETGTHTAGNYLWKAQ